MRKYLIMGKKHGGLNKQDRWPWLLTSNETKAHRALAYMKLQEPDYEWSIEVKDVSNHRL